MNGNELKSALDALGWSQRFFAQKLGVHVNTVTLWRNEGAPGYVSEYLRVMLLAKQMLESPYGRAK